MLFCLRGEAEATMYRLTCLKQRPSHVFEHSGVSKYLLVGTAVNRLL